MVGLIIVDVQAKVPKFLRAEVPKTIRPSSDDLSSSCFCFQRTTYSVSSSL